MRARDREVDRERLRDRGREVDKERLSEGNRLKNKERNRERKRMIIREKIELSVLKRGREENGHRERERNTAM